MPLLLSCGSNSTSPEDRIRQFLSAAEQAVESRSLSAVSPFLSEAYGDPAGHQKSAVLRLLAGYFLSHQSIHLLSQVTDIRLLGEIKAEVTLFVAVAGQPIDSTAQLLELRADLIRLDLTLVNEQGDWRVRSAQWRRAETRDFLE